MAVSPGGIEAVAALSPMQEGLLFHSLLDVGAGAYVNQHLIRLRGRIEVELFRVAWNSVVARHQALRMSFHWEDLEKPLIAVHSAALLEIPLLDWRGEPETEKRLQQFLNEDKRRSLPLTNAPLMRLSLIRMGEAEWVLYWCNHHLILDGWSAAIVARDVFAQYEALLAGLSIENESVPAFVDYLKWLQEQDQSQAERYWRKLLDGFSTPSSIQGGTGRAPCARYGQLALTLDTVSTRSLQATAVGLGATLSDLVQTMWAAVLAHYCRQPDVVFGVTSAGRPVEVPGIEQMAGLFINTLPVRVRFRSSDTFAITARKLSEQNLRLRALEHSPLDAVLRWSPLPPGTPLFESIVVFENYPVDRVLRGGAAGIEIADVEVIEATNYPLCLIAAPGDRLSLQLTFDMGRFSDEFIRRLLDHCRLVLNRLCAQPEQRILDLCLLTPSEHRQISGWQGAARPYDLSLALHEQIERQAVAAPARIAAAFPPHQVTYAELNAEANQFARYLRRSGVVPGSIVGICLDRSIEMIIALLATLKCGAAYLPLDPEYPPERIAYMVSDAKPAAVVTSHSFAQRFPACRRVMIDQDHAPWRKEARSDLQTRLTPEYPAYVIYTSGSTGRPKGSINTHRAICNRLLWMQQAFQLKPDDRVLQKTAFSFDVSVWEFFWPLMAGASIVFAKPGGHRDSAYLADFIAAHGVTTIHFVPSMLQAFLEEPAASRCGSLRRVICSGETLPYAVQQRFFGAIPFAELHNLYGPTETAVDVTWWPCRRNDPLALVPIGTPIANTRIHLLSPQLRPVPPGVAGELYIAGANVSAGYLNRAALSAERFLPDPFHAEPGTRMYRTGDLARYLHDGSIEFLGRIDFQVKIRGFRVELGEVEDALCAIPGVRQAVVTARERNTDERVLTAYLASETGLDTDEIRRNLERRLPGYMVPEVFVTLPRLPLNHNDKVDRNALPEAGPVAVRPRSAPRTATEQRLAGIWKELLGLSDVGVSDTFLESGGNSLLATRLTARIRSQFRIDLPLRALFDSPTIEQLARMLPSEAGPLASAVGIRKADRSRLQPLSYAQERIWFLSQVEGVGVAYHVPLRIELRGKLDGRALQKSLQDLVDRHESLRTAFVSEEGRPLQRIATDCQLDLRIAASSTEVVEEVSRPFDLAGPPLIRALLIWQSGETHELVLTIHHIAADGWSLEILTRDLCALYAQNTGGTPAALPEAEWQAIDHAVWQRAQGVEASGHFEYWKQQLKDAPLLELPCDRSRPPLQTFRGGSVTLDLPAAGVRKLAADMNASAFAVVLAGLAATIAKYSGQYDVCIGAPIAGREQGWTHEIVGVLINPVVLRIRINPDDSFRGLLLETKRILLDAMDHQDLPFEHLLSRLHVPRDPSRHPLFQVMAVMQENPLRAYEAAGLQIVPLHAPVRTAKFDLTVSFQPDKDSISCVWEYNTDLFDTPSVERMSSSFEAMLRAGLAKPETRIRELPVLNDQDSSRFLHEWAGETGPLFDPPVVHRLFEEQVRRVPHAVAITTGSDRITYAELNGWANAIACELCGHQARQEDRIGVAIARSPAQIAAMLGILKAGCVYVPLDPAWPAIRLQYMAGDTGMRLTLADCALPVEVEVVSIAGLPRSSENPPPIPTAASNIAYIMYTSGSTGQPKGVAVPNEAIVRLVSNQPFMRLDPDTRVAVAAPAAFDASTLEIWMPLLNGLTCVLLPDGPLSPDRLRAAAMDEGANAVWLTAGLFHTVVDESLESLEGYRQVLAGGDALSVPHVRRFVERYPGTRLVNGYGPTENTTFTTCYTVPPDIPASVARIPIGVPLRNTRVYLLDAHFQPVPIGATGEIYTGGAGLARGYWNQPALTAAHFLPDPLGAPGTRMYRTGDLGRRLPDGNLDILGRRDEQVKIRGYRVEPGELARHITAHPLVRDAAVLIEGPQSDRRLATYYTPRSILPEELRAYLAARVPAYLLPYSLVALDALPLAASGKLDRASLTGGDMVPRSSSPPSTIAEQQISSIWEEVLRVPGIGPDDNFFALGGDSLLCIRVCERAARKYGMRIPLVSLLQHQTVRSLAASLDAVKPVTLPPAEGTQPRFLSPSQHYFFSFDHADPHRYSLAQFFETRNRFSRQDLERLAEALATTHDALRLRFARENHSWKAVACTERNWAVDWFDFSSIDPGQQRAALEAEAERLGSELNIFTGPLFRLAYFDLGPQRTGRLFALVHHLVADGSSLWILFEDLITAGRQIAAGRQIELPEPLVSWNHWTEILGLEAVSQRFRATIGRWFDRRNAAVGSLPLDFPAGRNLQGSERDRISVFTAAETGSLVRKAAGDCMDIGHALFAAVASAVARNATSRLIQLDWIAHGRDGWSPAHDLSRTVGYFSSRTPVILDLTSIYDPDETIEAVRSAIESLPYRSLGFGMARFLSGEAGQFAGLPVSGVSFNFVGQIDRLRPEGREFYLAEESAGTTRAPSQIRALAIHVFADISDARLRFVWKYSSALHRESTIERLAEDAYAFLRDFQLRSDDIHPSRIAAAKNSE